MRLFVICLIAILVPISLVAGLRVRRWIDENSFSSSMLAINFLFAIAGFLLVSVINVMGIDGRPVIAFAGNLLVFTSPLAALGLGRLIRRSYEMIRRMRIASMI